MAALDPSAALCCCGVRGCDQHTAWTVAEIDWRKARKKRKRGR